jgi:membrane protein implicated in regulation of membrane protease activity
VLGGVVLWVIVAITALVIDIITSGLFFAGFTIGGIFAIVAWILGLSFTAQVVVFGLVSVAAVTIEYVWFRKKLKKSIPKTLRMEEEYIGRSITVEEDIENKGKIKVDGIYWTAQNSGEPIGKGERAKIIGIQGNKLIIKK